MSRPTFERTEAFVSVVFLAGLMIFTADNQQVVSFVARAYSFNSYVVIGIERVPVEPARYGAQRDARSNHIALIRRLLGVNRDQIVNGCVGSNYHCAGGNNTATARINA